ncbi:MAG: 50S ribosomal protein L30 [Rickettsiales bacterium]|nr:50S ribosomal protein L30 [Rickettsiales bacterium]
MKIKVRQVKSGFCRIESQAATLKGLGLGRIGRSRELADTPAIRGMIAKVAHLVKVEE